MPSGKNINLDRISESFKEFARLLTTGAVTSTIYLDLASKISKDSDLLDLSRNVLPGQLIPNMLFGAVHYLLLQDNNKYHPLTEYYPTLGGSNSKITDIFPLFKQFCQNNRTELISIIQTRRVQTNEIRRCALFIPGYEIVSQLNQRQPLSVIEIGASAGLNLNFDLYWYKYSNDSKVGLKSSNVELTCEIRGNTSPPIPKKLPVIATKIGIDLNPLDITNNEDKLWLQALIWPEHVERFEILDKAINIAQSNPPKILKGDGLALLDQALTECLPNSTICIIHSFTLNQFSEEHRQEFYNKLKAEGKKRPIYVLSLEWLNSKKPLLSLDIYQEGQRSEKTLAYGESHGNWLEWIS